MLSVAHILIGSAMGCRVISRLLLMLLLNGGGEERVMSK